MTEKTLITSRDNQRLKFARSVRECKIRDAVFIEGVRQAEEALRSSAEISEVFYDQKFADNERNRNLIVRLEKECEKINHVESRLFSSVAETNTPQGIILIVRKPQNNQQSFNTLVQRKSSKGFLIVFLSEINNPSNLGAILRTAEAAGVNGVIISAKSADAFSPKATRAALGANLRLPIWEKAAFPDVLNWAKEKELTTTAADINAGEKYTEVDWTQARLLIFGSEAHGLSEDARSKIENLIYIPMQNNVESLNLAVSCGIILFEAHRQIQFGK